MSIEDLVFFSQDTNDKKNSYSGKYVELGRTLNFESELSYCNYETTDYNSYLGVKDNVGLMESLTNTKYSGFKPIGIFAGSFDGKGYVIKNLYEHNNGNAGLFKDLSYNGRRSSLKNLEITGEIICEGNSVGGLSAFSGEIENCISRVNIVSSGEYVGGINGNAAVISNCENYGIIKGNKNIGGITGYGDTTTDCRNYGEIEGEGSSGLYVGGISGLSRNSVVRCVNYAKVKGIDCVGGIVGWSNSIRNCFNNGEVEATNDYAGGIIGRNTTHQPVINCYNLGKVKSNKTVGGIVGCVWYTQNEDSRMINCYSIGMLEGNVKGGIVGRKTGYGTHYIENCYWPTEFNINALSNPNETNFSGNYGKVEINEKTTAYEKTFMQSQEFVDILNNYVTTYNEAHKEDADFVELLTWELDSETKYPTLNFD